LESVGHANGKLLGAGVSEITGNFAGGFASAGGVQTVAAGGIGVPGINAVTCAGEFNSAEATSLYAV